MTVTVIIPNFNEEKTIIEILKRVNNQKSEYMDMEIIVIDDCSTDRSKELLKENPNLYTKLIELDKNLGKGGAVKEGLLNASGEYILFQDADLEYDPTDYKKIFRIIKDFFLIFEFFILPSLFLFFFEIIIFSCGYSTSLRAETWLAVYRTIAILLSKSNIETVSN